MFAQFNAAKNFVIERTTLDLKNSGSKAVSEVVVCHPSDLTSSRAFFEVSSWDLFLLNVFINRFYTWKNIMGMEYMHRLSRAPLRMRQNWR